VKQLQMFSHQEKCPICQTEFVALALEYQYVVNLPASSITLKVAVCSVECATEAVQRLEEFRNAARKIDKWS